MGNSNAVQLQTYVHRRDMASGGEEEEGNATSAQTVDEVFDRIVRNAPDAMFDTRAYYWPNFKSPSLITHSFRNFTYSFSLPTISVPGSYYVTSFGEPLLLTWVGLETKVKRKIGASTNILINDGDDPFLSMRCNLFHYCKVPLPVRKQEPDYVYGFMAEDKVNKGLVVHYRVCKYFSIELKAWFDDTCVVFDPTVVVKVQTPTLVGGLRDHPKWNVQEYLQREADKTHKYFPTYMEYKIWMQSVYKDKKN